MGDPASTAIFLAAIASKKGVILGSLIASLSFLAGISRDQTDMSTSNSTPSSSAVMWPNRDTIPNNVTATEFKLYRIKKQCSIICDRTVAGSTKPMVDWVPASMPNHTPVHVRDISLALKMKLRMRGNKCVSTCEEAWTAPVIGKSTDNVNELKNTIPSDEFNDYYGKYAKDHDVDDAFFKTIFHVRLDGQRCLPRDTPRIVLDTIDERMRFDTFEDLPNHNATSWMYGPSNIASGLNNHILAMSNDVRAYVGASASKAWSRASRFGYGIKRCFMDTWHWIVWFIQLVLCIGVVYVVFVLYTKLKQHTHEPAHEPVYRPPVAPAQLPSRSSALHTRELRRNPPPAPASSASPANTVRIIRPSLYAFERT